MILDNLQRNIAPEPPARDHPLVGGWYTISQAHAARSIPATGTSDGMATPGSHVLVVDGDTEVRNHLLEYLGDHDFRVSAAGTGKDALRILSREAIDLILLETQLRDEDGLRLAQAVRDSTSTPIVIVSRRSEEADRVMALELGADDYVTKPFAPRELLARIRAVLRRTTLQRFPSAAGGCLRAYRFEGWELNLRLLSLTAPDGRNVHLTRGEFGLLRAFLSAPQRVLTRNQLLDLTHVNGADVYDRSVDVLVARVRRKIEADPSRPRFIRCERGVGYYFNASSSALR